MSGPNRARLWSCALRGREATGLLSSAACGVGERGERGGGGRNARPMFSRPARRGRLADGLDSSPVMAASNSQDGELIEPGLAGSWGRR
jgi:hypothetical protein